MAVLVRTLPLRLVCPFLLSAASPTHTGGMSQTPNSNSKGGKASKRKSDGAAAAASLAQTSAADDRAVRQRAEQMQPAVATPTAAATTPAAAAPSLSTPPVVLSFLRLAVVERQLIMQGLDFRSLARLASSCKQMRGEALDKEAGKFLEPPHEYDENIFYRAHCIEERPSAHASPLFRKHAPMILDCCSYFGRVDHGSLIHRVAQFSRVVKFRAEQSDWWTEERMLQILSLPCTQHLTELSLSESLQWLARPLVQAAVLRLPRLMTLDMVVGPATKLLPNAFATAATLLDITIEVTGGRFPDGSLRALRLAPSLEGLCLRFCKPHSPLPPELLWCIPPTLRYLTLWQIDLPIGMSRPLLKTLFSHIPMLSTLRLSSVSIETTLRGLLDAGAAALPALLAVQFEHMQPHHFLGHPRNSLERIFRRFVRRFPHVTVRIEFEDHSWDDPDELHALQLRYAGWPTVEMYSSNSGDRVGGPPCSDTSDDEDRSDAEVETMQDPLAAQGH